MQYSFDSSALIEELKGDIYDEGPDMMVWAYWIYMPNGQKLYVDYYYVDGDAPFGPTLDQFDLKVRQEHGIALRKKMPATELLEILKKEDKTMTYSNETIKEMQDKIWDEFTDPDAAGVKMEDILTGARDIMGVKLTDDQIQSVVEHYNYADDWTEQDEKVRDLIADATDSEDGEKLFSWMAWIDGDQAAEEFVDYHENN